jgi:predicted GNAT superfamily acetyltransferase
MRQIQARNTTRIAPVVIDPDQRGYAENWWQDRTDEMTPERITKAERLVAEWQPNPVECEIEGAQPEN